MGYMRTARWGVWMLLVAALLALASGVLQLVALGDQPGPTTWPQRSGWFAAFFAAAIAFFLVWATAAALAAETPKPDRLEDELADVERSSEFQSRMQLLSRAGAPEQELWSLRLEKILGSRASHVSFVAVASRGAEEVRLWGKRYKIGGFLASFKRAFLPSYESATWGILCTLHSHGISSPVPIIRCRPKKGHIATGTLILAEHVGRTQSLKTLIRSNFASMPAEQRMTLVRKLADYVSQVHAVGVYDFTPRYFHIKNLDDPENLRFYLFDLDKAHLPRRAPAWLRRYSRSRGLRRLRRMLQHYGTPEERKAFEEELQRTWRQHSGERAAH